MSDEPRGIGRWMARFLARCLMVVMPLVLLAALAAGLGYVRVSHGPVSLPFLADPIARGLAAEFPGVKVDIGDVVLTSVEGGLVEFRLRDLRLRETDGDVVASAPEAAVELSWAGLQAFRVVPSRVQLIEPSIALTYAEDGRLALSISDPSRPSAPTGGSLTSSPSPVKAPAPAASAPRASPDSANGAESWRRIDVVRVFAEASARARQGSDAASYIREVGVRNATVTFAASNGRSTRWLVPDMAIDLDHRAKASVLSGSATVAASRGPWSLTFRVEDNDKSGRRVLAFTSSVRGLTPSVIATAFPDVGFLNLVDMPLSGDAAFDMSTQGEILSGRVAVELGTGQVQPGALSDQQVAIDAGLLKFKYDGGTGRLELEPSTVVSGPSRLTLAGAAQRELPAGGGPPSWPFSVAARDGVLAAEGSRGKGVPVDLLTATGRVSPTDASFELSSLAFRAGGGEVNLKAAAVVAGSKTGSRLDVRMSPMPVATLKAIWPKLIAPEARAWFLQQVGQGQFRGGTFQVSSGALLDGPADTAKVLGYRLTGAADFTDVQLTPVAGAPVIEAPKVALRIDNEAFEVAIPDAVAIAGPTRRLPLKGGRFSIADTRRDIPIGEVALRVVGPLAPFLDILEQPPLAIIKPGSQKPDGVDGKVDGQFRVRWPLTASVDPADIKVEGKARLVEGRAKGLAGSFDVHGATVTLDITEKAADASGEMLVNGVPAKLTWQRIYDSPDDRQPPLRLTARLDASDRNQLGIDINHIVIGEVPIEVTVTGLPRAEPKVEVRADLTSAELLLDSISWRKPSGRTAIMQFDVARPRPGRTELQGFKIVGDDLAIEGLVVLGAENKLKEFSFPSFSLNVVSRLAVDGHLRADNVLEVKAKGPTWDGRDVFRSLFHVGQISDPALKQQKPRAGLDLEAEIDTVIGFSEVSLRALKLRIGKRADRLTELRAYGTLDGGKPLAAEFRPATQNDPRRILADSTDAGQLFRLVGFYPNVQGGRVRLEVNVDGRGPAEKTGVLWIDSFRVLGDPVVSEVFSGAEGVQVPGMGMDSRSQSDRRPQRKVVRETFDFDSMKAPFSVGHGQFVLEDAYLRGPILGATMRGKVDYATRRIDLSGTYIPLQGLNNALGDIPVLGQLLSGPRSEGVFGITFAIQGAMSEPNVIVNPLSMVAPGIFREMFQLSNPDTAVRARGNVRPEGPAESRVRSSSTPALEGKTPPQPAAAPSRGARQPETIDGWSSSGEPAKARKP